MLVFNKQKIILQHNIEKVFYEGFIREGGGPNNVSFDSQSREQNIKNIKYQQNKTINLTF